MSQLHRDTFFIPAIDIFLTNKCSSTTTFTSAGSNALWIVALAWIAVGRTELSRHHPSRRWFEIRNAETFWVPPSLHHSLYSPVNALHRVSSTHATVVQLHHWVRRWPSHVNKTRRLTLYMRLDRHQQCGCKRPDRHIASKCQSIDYKTPSGIRKLTQLVDLSIANGDRLNKLKMDVSYLDFPKKSTPSKTRHLPSNTLVAAPQ